MKVHETVETLGLLCPLPVLKARKRLQTLEAGQILQLIADDPAARIDVPHFCNEQDHRLIAVQESGRGWIFTIAKGPS